MDGWLAVIKWAETGAEISGKTKFCLTRKSG